MSNFKDQIINDRYEAINDLNWIAIIAGRQVERTKGIALIDDPEYADIVRGFAERVHEIRIDMEELASLHHIKI